MGNGALFARCARHPCRVVSAVGTAQERLCPPPEFGFNLHLAKLIGDRLKSEGFAATRVLVTEGKARASLLKRVGTANDAHADFFLSVHHDSVPDKMLEEWEFDGARSFFSDRFG